jgi:hypothetical protein
MMEGGVPAEMSSGTYNEFNYQRLPCHIKTPQHPEPNAPYSQCSLHDEPREDRSIPRHLPTFLAHFEPFGGCCNSNDDNFEFPFSSSKDCFEAGCSSSILAIPDRDGLFWRTSLGNVDRRGVNAVTTFFADLRIVLRTSHDLFLAM